jgi:hypothetical protein
MRYKRIQNFAIEVLKPIIEHLKKIKKTNRMPWRELEAILKILYPETKYEERRMGYFKNVFIIHNDKRWFALKIGRNPQHIRKDMSTYNKLPIKSRNRNFAKIYWAKDIFMLQKWGEKVEVPRDEVKRLKEWGKEHNLKDIRPANIMKVDGRFKIVDAELSR